MREENTEITGHDRSKLRLLGDTQHPRAEIPGDRRYDGERLVQLWLTRWRKTLTALLAMIEEKSAKT